MNCSITFDANSIIIQHCSIGQLISEGHESKELYYLCTRPPVSCLASRSPKLLHYHLGHPSLSKLKRMILELRKLQVLQCELCQLGKHVRSSFPKRIETRCNSIFSIFILIFGVWVRSLPLGFIILSLLLMNILGVLGFT